MDKPIIIGVAGGTGAGKTTVTDQIYKSVSPDQIAFLHHDSYYKDQSEKPLEERVKTNYDHPESLETNLMIKHLMSLLEGVAVDVPVYDFSIHNRTKKTEHVKPKPLVLVEGILIFGDKTLRELMDIKIFVDTDEDVRFIRRLKRDIADRGRTMENVIDQYLSTVKPMHLQFVEPSKRYADIIIPEGGYNKVALKMITSRVKDLLTEMSS